MALRIELIGDKPGVAKLLIQQWQGDPDVDILIQRNQDGYYLADNGQWVAEIYWHNIPNLTLDNGKLQGIVTNWLVDSLLSQENHVRFLVTVRNHQNENSATPYSDRGAINIAETVLASSALDTDSRTDELMVNSVPVIDETPLVNETPETEKSEQQEEPTADKMISKTKKSKKGMILLLLTLLALLAITGGLAWYFLQDSPKPVLPVLDESPAALTSQCTIANADDDLLFIQQCLQTAPNSETILQVINQAKVADKCNIAQRLYANQSQKHGDIAFMYAKEYDPQYYQANNCFHVDNETAIYWYETALSLEPNNESALIQQRLDALKK